jgi:hypothetical protein
VAVLSTFQTDHILQFLQSIIGVKNNQLGRPEIDGSLSGRPAKHKIIERPGLSYSKSTILGSRSSLLGLQGCYLDVDL